MPFKVSVLDITAAIVVLVVLALPDRSLQVVQAYETEGAQEREIALYQAKLASDPQDTEAVDSEATDTIVRRDYRTGFAPSVIV